MQENYPVLPPDHDLRAAINDELHIHPYEPLTPPERIALFAMLVSPEERLREEKHLENLSGEFGGVKPKIKGNQIRFDFGRFRLKIERHYEFTQYKFVWSTNESLPTEPFLESVNQLLPDGWLHNLPGKVLTAMNIAFLPFPAEASSKILIDRYASIFDSSSLVGSQVGRSKGIVLTDFKICDDGFIRVMIFTKAALPSQNGRLLLRLIEVETYRMMALLAIPDARKLLSVLPKADKNLTDLTLAIASGEGTEDDKLLEDLTYLAASVENLVASNYRRFSASRAYFDLVFKRLKDLREEPIETLPSLGGILERRLEPGRSTCESVSRWLDQLALRVSHASQLLRTRIDVRRESQNQQLLVSMNKRFQIQLRLQETAELLSIVIIPYYGVNLLGYIVEEIDNVSHWSIDPLMIKAISAPILAALALLLMSKMRKRQDPDL